MFGERGAHRCDHRLVPSLPQCDHVRVPLDDARTVLARKCRARLVEPVEDPALVKELRLWCVHVLRLQRIVLVQLAGLEAEDASLPVREREQQPPLEVVVAALSHESGGAQLLTGEALVERLARERRAAERKAEPELAADVLAEPAA